MDLDALEAEIALLVTEMEKQPEDKHELYTQIREKVSEIRVFGMPVPKDLLDLEKALEQEFAARK